MVRKIWRGASLRSARLSVACALLLTITAQSQPLTPGVEVEGSRFFLDDGLLKRVDQENGVSRLEATIPEGSQLLQPEAWKGRASLLLGTTSASLITPTGVESISLERPEPAEDSQEKKEPPAFKSYAWGDTIIIHLPESPTLHFLRADGSVEKLELDASIRSLHTLDPERLLTLLDDNSYGLHSADDLQGWTKTEHELGEMAQVVVSDNAAAIWSEDFPTVQVIGPQQLHSVELDSKPTGGAAGIDQGQFVFLLSENIALLDGDGELRSLPSPSGLKKENLGRARFFTYRDKLQFLLPDSEQGLTNMSFSQSGQASGGLLGKEEIKSLILPTPGSADRPFLLTETSFEEDRVDASTVVYNGESVVNPKTSKPEKQTIKGHALYMLSEQGNWTALTNEPRTRVIGAAEVVAGNLIYPTQTEPENTIGTERATNWTYPHAPVGIRAINASSGVSVWSFEAPRGKAPSPARIPQDTWPKLGSDGPILYTTESNQLAALDASTGKVEWNSESLPLDESRPSMLRWGNSLGLVATNNTTKKFLLFNNGGKLVASSTLNEIFNSERKLNLAGVLIICLALVVYIYVAGKKKLFIRKIAGLEALDEAVGRATEMGKPVLYVTGLADVDDIQTLASLSILSHVSKKTAEYDSSIISTTSRAVTFSAAQEVVRDAFTVAGRPDSFSVESVQYISDDQFGYAAGVDGLMLREEPAANFYMGKFYAESLIFAETGNATGAIQIAGTAQANQLPFFVAACDYTLIGEELFAASAYLSGDPLQVGSLRGQDVGKAIVMVLLVLASLYVTFFGGAS